MKREFNKVFNSKMDFLDWLNQELLMENVIGCRLIYIDEGEGDYSVAAYLAKGHFVLESKEV